MLRSLVEVLPFMVVPKWVTKTKCQPISIGNVLESLLSVLGREEASNKVFEIGGPEVVTYREMMDVCRSSRIEKTINSSRSSYPTFVFALG